MPPLNTMIFTSSLSSTLSGKNWQGKEGSVNWQSRTQQLTRTRKDRFQVFLSKIQFPVDWIHQLQRPCWDGCCCLLGFNSGVPYCRGARDGWKCKQRFVGDHTEAFEAGDQRRGEERRDTLIKETIDGGGVVPHTHKSIISKKSSKK